MKFLDHDPCPACPNWLCKKHGFCRAEVAWMEVPEDDPRFFDLFYLSGCSEEEVRNSCPCLAIQADTAASRAAADAEKAAQARANAASGWRGVTINL